MNFFLISQGGRLQAGWGEQHNMLLKPDHGRSYEPPAFGPGTTFRNVLLLMEFFKLTGDDRFIARIPDAIAWLERIKLPNAQSQGGRYSHPVFVEPGTNKTLYAHRKGSNVINGKYWWDYKDDNPLLHYGAKTKLDLERLKKEYQSLTTLSPQELATMLKNSPLKSSGENNPPTPQELSKKDPYSLIGKIMDLQMLSSSNPAVKTNEEVRQIILSLKNGQYWESRHIQISRPYAILPDGTESNTAKLSNEGGAAITDSSDQIYISTRDYIKNMKSLISYLKAVSN
ncbi:MAG: hypothetical protein H3C48_03015 [Chitinophagaceae bacterium]|nr:hypothetical protein [Chitinophagaceae bacterium]